MITKNFWFRRKPQPLHKSRLIPFNENLKYPARKKIFSWHRIFTENVFESGISFYKSAMAAVGLSDKQSPVFQGGIQQSVDLVFVVLFGASKIGFLSSVCWTVFKCI